MGIAHRSSAKADDVAARIADSDCDAVSEHVAPCAIVTLDDEAGLDNGLAVGSDGF